MNIPLITLQELISEPNAWAEEVQPKLSMHIYTVFASSWPSSFGRKLWKTMGHAGKRIEKKGLSPDPAKYSITFSLYEDYAD